MLFASCKEAFEERDSLHPLKRFFFGKGYKRRKILPLSKKQSPELFESEI
jgi:hypothetical protein